MLEVGKFAFDITNSANVQILERIEAWGYIEGNARKIDNLMTDALTIGAQQVQHCISAEIVMAAANNQALT